MRKVALILFVALSLSSVAEARGPIRNGLRRVFRPRAHAACHRGHAASAACAGGVCHSR